MRPLAIFLIALIALPYSALAYIIAVDTGTTCLADIHSGDSNWHIAQSFTTVGAGNLSQVVVLMADEGTNPTDNLTAGLWTMSAGIPNFSVSSSTAVDSTNINSDTGEDVTFTWPTPPAVNAGAQYAIVWSRSAGPNANYIVVCGSNADTYAGGTRKRLNKTTGLWSDIAQDINVDITITDAAGAPYWITTF